jgi:phosphoadenosine phosphosulfate reductase
MRFCCEFLKESYGAGRTIVTGVRWEESNKRAQRRMFESCHRDGSMLFLHPIIDWHSDEVWDFLHVHDVPVNPLYALGQKRVGCVFCPMSDKGQRLRDEQRYPRYAALWVRRFDRLLADRKVKGKNTTFGSGKEWFRWWIEEPSPCGDAEEGCGLYG